MASDNNNSNHATLHLSDATSNDLLSQKILDLLRRLSALISTMCMNQALQPIPFYDGYTMPLEDFLQAVENGRLLITEAQEPYYIKLVILKIKGKARQSIKGMTFNTFEELKKHLKEEPAPAKTYHECMSELLTTTMKREDTVRNFYHRLLGIIEAALSTADTEFQDVTQKEKLRPLLEKLALQTFIKGLPEAWRIPVVVISRPKTLAEAVEAAVLSEKACPTISQQQQNVYRIPSNDPEALKFFEDFEPGEKWTTDDEGKPCRIKQVRFADPSSSDRKASDTPPELDEYERIKSHPNLSYAANHNRPNTPPPPRTPRPNQQLPPFSYPHYYNQMPPYPQPYMQYPQYPPYLSYYPYHHYQPISTPMQCGYQHPPTQPFYPNPPQPYPQANQYEN